MTTPLLEINDLTVSYGGRTNAVEGISLRLEAGETLGIVGESGSGKSTLARAIVGLSPVRSGSIKLEGKEIGGARGRARRLLARKIQYVFQDPYSSLNPTRSIEDTLLEPLLASTEFRRPEQLRRVREMLDLVGMPKGTENRYPRSFSGGQRQRIAIARALIVSPQLVICDEPTASLDLSIQAQILHLLRDLQSELKISYLFIAHNLDVVQYMSNRTMVMHQGVVVEQGPSAKIAGDPEHLYTKILVAATPLPHPVAQAQHRKELARIKSGLESGNT